MFYRFRDIAGFSLHAKDADFGSVRDLYFDDTSWIVRFLVASTGPWLFGREVLIPSRLLGVPDLRRRTWPVDLSREEVEDAAGAETNPPVSEQLPRIDFAALSPYLVAPPDGGYSPVVAEQFLAMEARRHGTVEERSDHDPNLRSMSEVLGYSIAATDGEIGEVDDCLVHPEDWRLQYLIVDTGGWLTARLVVIPCDWVTDVSWADRQVAVAVSKDTVENSPQPGDMADIAEDELQRLHAHYTQPMI